MIEELEKELFSKYNNLHGINGIANVYMLSKQFDKAEKICSFDRLGKVYENMNVIDKAENAYKKYNHKISLIEFYERTNDFSKAEQVCEHINFEDINQIFCLLQFYERRYRHTNDEKYMKTAEEIRKKHYSFNKFNLAHFYKLWYDQSGDKKYLDKEEEVWKEIGKQNNGAIFLANFYQRLFEQTKNKQYLDKIMNSNVYPQHLAKFYEQQYEKTNDPKFLDKVEQLLDRHQTLCAEFYERLYKRTSNEELMKKAEQIWKAAASLN